MELAGGKSPVPAINLDADEEHTPPLQQKTHAPAGSIDPLTPAQLNSINSGKGNRAVQVLYNGSWDVDEDTYENSDSELRSKLQLWKKHH